MPCFARDSGDFVKCSEITDCGKSEQNFAICYYLLVVTLVVKQKVLLPTALVEYRQLKNILHSNI